MLFRVLMIAVFLTVAVSGHLGHSSVFYFHTLGKSAPPVNPTSLSLAHSARTKSFTVSWVAGANNGGANGCRLEYQKSNLSWASLVLVNCDSSGASVGSVTLPGDSWYGASWSSVPVRLVRVSDAAVIGTLGNLTCSATSASSSPTPSVDENCDNYWDNTSSDYCELKSSNAGPWNVGSSYSFAATISKTTGYTENGSCASVPNGTTMSLYQVQFSKAVKSYSTVADCNSRTGGFTTQVGSAAHSTSPSGTIPACLYAACSSSSCFTSGQVYHWTNQVEAHDTIFVSYRYNFTLYY